MKKLSNIEFMRAFCAIGVVIYHFSHYCFCSHKLFSNYATGLWGEACVIVFFALSGGLLYMNDKSIGSLKTFYLKRFKTIFPMFYISYLFFFIPQAWSAKNIFYRTDCPPWTLIFSVIGLDGYFRYAFINYYILGEWFLGAIIFAYLVYPLLAKGLNRHPIFTTIIMTGLFSLMLLNIKMGRPVSINITPSTPTLGLISNILSIEPFRNPISCIFAFYVGMLLFRYKAILENNAAFILSAVGIFSLATINFSISQTLSQHLMGYCLFISLYKIGQLICKVEPLEKISIFLGKISYPIFLLQAVLIQRLLNYKNPTTLLPMLTWLCVTTVFIIICATILYYVNKVIMLPFSSKNKH